MVMVDFFYIKIDDQIIFVPEIILFYFLLFV